MESGSIVEIARQYMDALTVRKGEDKYILAGSLLCNAVCGRDEIQELLDRASEFRRYGPERFGSYGIFLCSSFHALQEANQEKPFGLRPIFFERIL